MCLLVQKIQKPIDDCDGMNSSHRKTEMRLCCSLISRAIVNCKSRKDQNLLISNRHVYSNSSIYNYDQIMGNHANNCPNNRLMLHNCQRQFVKPMIPYQNLWYSLERHLLYKALGNCGRNVRHLHCTSNYHTDIPPYLMGSISAVESPEEEDEMDNVDNEREEEIIEFLSSRAIVFEETDTSFVVECPTCQGTQGKHRHARDIFVDKHTGYYVCPWCCGDGSWEELCLVLDARSDCLTQAQLDSVLETTQPLSDASAAVLVATPYKNLNVATLQRFGCRLTLDSSRLIVPVWQSHCPQGEESIGNTLHLVGYYSVALLQCNAEVVCRFLKGQASAWSSLNSLDQNPQDASPSSMVVVSHVCEALHLAHFGIPVVTIPNNVLDWQHTPARQHTRPNDATNRTTQFKIYEGSHGSNDATSSVVGSPVDDNRSNIKSGTPAIVPNIWGLGEDVRRVVMWLTSSNTLPYRFYAHLSRCGLTCSAVSPAGSTPLFSLRRELLCEQLQGDLLVLLSDKITTFEAIQDKIYYRITHKEEVCGVPWRRFPELQAVLLGHRAGEVTVLSGPTGAGKTTFAAEYSLDLAMQGVSTLWASLEVSVVRLCEVLLQQFSGAQLPADKQQFEALAHHFQQLPLHFLDLHGQQDLQQVMQAVREGAVVRGVRHVIVDNLQFLVGCQESAQERWMQQDRAMAAFRTFATQHRCHVTLIVHPRKLQPSELLTLQSIGGGARVTQEADNVLLLQVHGNNPAFTKKAIEVVKNRYGGHLGVVPLKFHGESLTFSNCFRRTRDDRKQHTHTKKDFGSLDRKPNEEATHQ